MSPDDGRRARVVQKTCRSLDCPCSPRHACTVAYILLLLLVSCSVPGNEAQVANDAGSGFTSTSGSGEGDRETASGDGSLPPPTINPGKHRDAS